MTGPFINHARSMVMNGYAVIPIPEGKKGPVLPNWENLSLLSVEQVDDFIKGKYTTEVDGEKRTRRNVRDGDGVGILTKHTPAIDIDCLDAEISASMVKWCTKHLGVAPVRVGKAPKTLLVYATEKPFKKITSARFYDPSNPDVDPKKKGQRLEVLGDGQQFVAYHVHPETGRPYQWTEDWQNPLEVSVFDIPVITEDEAEAACAEFERLCKLAGWEKLGDGSSSTDTSNMDASDWMAELDPPDEDEAEVERVKSALAVMDQSREDLDYDYEQWRNVLFALKWTRWDCAEALARAWSETSHKHVTKEFNTVWRGAQKRDRGREVTLATIYGMAKTAGWDASRSTEPTAEEQEESFDTIMKLIKDIPNKPKALVAVAEVIEKIAAAKLGALYEGPLLKALKNETGTSMSDLRKALRDQYRANSEKQEEDFLPTHAGYAAKMIEELEEKTGSKPVGTEGMIYTFSERTGVWAGRPTPDFGIDVAKRFDGNDNCSRRTDYLAIAGHMFSTLSATTSDYFLKVPVGLACKGRFYKLNDNGEIVKEELEPHHRQRVLSPVKPTVGPMPLFEQFLAQTFEGDDPADEQINLLQEIIGSTLIGSFPRYQKAVLFKGGGRAGKGTLLTIISSMLPREMVSAASPMKWDDPYTLASMAGKRLNLVGELGSDTPIPDANFKSVIGRDSIQARNPYEKPFDFVNTASHIFNSNYFITTKDHSEAFFSRWVLIGFPNSRAETDAVLDVGLAERIIASELPQIMAWALKGAKRLEERGRLVMTNRHHEMMAQWRERTNTLVEFLIDDEYCKLTGDGKVFVRRSSFYEAYVKWCKDAGRRPLGKSRAFDEMEGRAVARLNVRTGFDRDGIRGVRGVILRGTEWQAFEDLDDEL